MIMFIRVICILFLGIIVSRAVADVKISRKCESYTNLTEFNLDLEKLTGKWYEVNSYSTDLACTEANFVKNANGETMTLTVTGVQNKKQVKKQVEIVQKDGNQVGISDSIFYVLGMDYNKYVVIWNCTQQDGLDGSTQNLWILTKDNQVTIDNLPEVTNIFNKTTILLDDLQLAKTAYDAETCALPGEDSDTGSASKCTLSIGILAALCLYILF